MRLGLALMFFFAATALIAVAADVAAGGQPVVRPDQNIGALFTQYFNFAFLLAGVLAFGAIVYGGFQYMISAGNPSGQSDARDRVLQAIIGLLLLVGSGLILRTIDEGLLNIQLGELGELKPESQACATPCQANESCLINPITNKGTCVQCSLPCGENVCMFTGPNQTPKCEPCPADVKSACEARGQVCKASGKNFVCAAWACGDNGADGPCPAGCTCHLEAGAPRPYQCVKQNSTEKCGTTLPPRPAASACTMCRWQDPSKPACGIIGERCDSPPNIPGCTFQTIGSPTPC